MLQRVIKLKYILSFFILAQLLIMLIVFLNEAHDKKLYLKNKTQLSQTEYETIYSKIKEQSTMIFQEHIYKDKIINLFKNAYKASIQEKAQIREELYNILLPSYTRLHNLINLRQLHFHFPNNHSFLRMHKPSKFGDDLSGIRATVEYVNKHRIEIDGFEEGRVYNGFRFVYPIFDKEKIYIGSVEVSFSASSFQNTLSHEARFSQFLFLKELVVQKVWKDEYNINYTPSTISPKFLLDSSWLDDEFTPFKRKIRKNMTPQVMEIFEKNLISKKAYSISLEIDSSTAILSFLPIKNPVNRKIAAYLVIITKNNYLDQLYIKNYLITLVSFALLLSIFVLIYRHDKHIEDIQIQHDLLLQQSKMAQMGSMLSNIAHQWKQPLARVNSKLLKIPFSLSLSDKEKISLEEQLEKIENDTTYMADTIESFRTYFRPNKSKNYFYVDATINKAISLLNLNTKQSNLNITISSNSNVRIHCYEDELIQVLIILIINAKEALILKDIKKPILEIYIADKKSKVEISVLDNAGGIDNNTLKQMYNPYFTTKNNSQNDGIGLYMAKMIIEGSMQGKLEYIKDDNKSIFTIILQGLKNG